MTFTCEYCDKEFGQRGTMNRHINTLHLKTKDFKCGQCEKEFGQKRHLQTHIQAIHLRHHYSCNECEKSFAYMCNLKNHIKNVHLKQKNYECDQCSFTCSQNGNLKLHINSIHINPSPKSMSRGEAMIKAHLNALGCQFTREATFDDLDGLRGKPLRFDFKVTIDEETFVLIEYDGEQHFRPVRFGGISAKQALRKYKTARTHDRMKDDYCRDNGFEILRIKYDQCDIAFDMIKAFLKLHTP